MVSSGLSCQSGHGVLVGIDSKVPPQHRSYCAACTWCCHYEDHPLIGVRNLRARKLFMGAECQICSVIHIVNTSLTATINPLNAKLNPIRVVSHPLGYTPPPTPVTSHVNKPNLPLHLSNPRRSRDANNGSDSMAPS